MLFSSLIAVKDVKAARKFYEELFDLTVDQDFGLMVSFDCGLVLQEDFHWLVGIGKEEIKEKENNCELYFETGDFDALAQKIKARQDVNLLHDIVEQSWGQRAIRFYDLDSHLVEVGESMKGVVQRFLAQGMSITDIAAKMDVTASDVQKMLAEEDC